MYVNRVAISILVLVRAYISSAQVCFETRGVGTRFLTKTHGVIITTTIIANNKTRGQLKSRWLTKPEVVKPGRQIEHYIAGSAHSESIVYYMAGYLCTGSVVLWLLQ